MGRDNDNEARGVDSTDQPTGEFLALGQPAGPAPVNGTEQPTGEFLALERAAGPQLERAAGPPPNNVVELKAASRPSPSENDESARAAFWLAHLETEVSRLHAKWQTIDAEFKSREARIADLHGQVAAREARIAKLTADLQREAVALDAAEARIASKDAEIAAFAEERRQRDERVAALSTELAEAEVAHKATREDVERARAETARLNEIVRLEQAAAAVSAQRHAEMVEEQQVLQTKLQDLEVYINGRHDSWAEQTTKLADYKDALIGMERTVKARDAAIARHDEEKRQLAARILELERQCSELTGRRKEREEAYDELQKKLAIHFEQTEQLKAEHATRLKEMERATKQAVDSQRHIESLERGMKRRDENIEALTSELEQSKSAVAELTSSRNKAASRAEELEKGVAERSQQMQALREDLRMGHDQLRLAQQQLSDRTTQLASTQEAADNKGRHIERLTKQLEDVLLDAAQVRAALEKVEADVVELGRQRGEAVAESENLKAELAAQQDLVSSLESELKRKQATEALLERSVGRITDLGASLAALDKQMSADVDDEELPADASMLLPRAGKTSLHLADFVATLADDDDDAEAVADPAAKLDDPEVLSMDLLLDDGPDEVVDVGEQTPIEGARKLVVTMGGEMFDYPIVKNLMTIGRGHGADIRIQSHYVSRVHAKISTKASATIIEDADSKNGILVNSEPVKRRVLRHGDVVSIGGELNMRFVDAAH
jgi:DNA repair exonuclease SbcCD ATPase subunit